MNFIKDRGIWIVICLILISGIYYWTVVDSDRQEDMDLLEVSDDSLKGDVNEWSEYYKRLEKKWIGTSKHVQTLQIETHEHYATYENKMDSIDIVFEEIKFSIKQLDEFLTQKINHVKNDITNLEDSFETYKRSTNRTIRELKQKISTIQDDINTLNITVFPPAEEENKNK